ncbi:hypothetical protein EGI22_08235 [Lacihabitans sp. LS3-19]|uniref:RHS repeat-associated core domain-containing protein n=1 Tax=Lacihabitans sp. LS3-19 TaxID=2487335 RepID=UPI0020CBFEC4|nr:RHS repeat-associated core domain-containing protein [Lacihabitans sp. LS3-19]MCP9767898.1 hypothetical protein [Lacihabitans sp. LS3-19]
MKKILLLTILFISKILSAQTVYTITSSDLNCPSSNTYTGTCGSLFGNNMKLLSAFISNGSTLNLSARRCATNLATTGTMAIKESTSNSMINLGCGNPYDVKDVSSATSVDLSVNLANIFTSGTRYFCVTRTSGTARYYTGIVAVTATQPSCNSTTSGSISTITTNSFTANWNPVSGATEYQVSRTTFSDVNYNAALTYTQTSTSRVLIDLVAGTQYRCRVRVKCNNGIWGSWNEIGTPTTLTAQPNLTMNTNISLGASTLYSGLSYAGSFSVSNTGTASWTGSMYVSLSNSPTSIDLGYYTIAAGTTRTYNFTYSPSGSGSVTLTAKYQTGGTGSGITVPGQSPPTLSLVGDLAINGNVVSPVSGVVNQTDFTFSATLSNVAPSPFPSVDLELKAPDGNIYYRYGINNTSGYSFSNIEKLQQLGVYRYRYVGKQSGRISATSHSSDSNTWATLTVNPQPLTVIPYTVTPSTGTQQFTSFTFQASYSGGNNTTPGIEFRFLKPSGGSEEIITDQAPTDVTYNPTTKTWSLTKTMLESGTYRYRYIIYQNGVSSISDPQYLVVSPPITIGNITSPLNWHCNKDITWSSIGITGNVSVELYKVAFDGDAFVATLADGIANSSPFTWMTGKKVDPTTLAANALDIPDFQTNGTYKLKMYQTGTTGKASWSNTFTFNNPSLSVSSPVAQTVYNGQQVAVNWSVNNFCNTISIEIVPDGATVGTPLASQIPTNGPHTVTIPNNLPPGQYKMKVYAFVTSGGSPAFNYSPTFTVANQSVSVPSPAINSTYYYGANLPITWNFAGGYSGNVTIELTKGPTSSVSHLVLFNNITNDGNETYLNLPDTLTSGQYRVKIYNVGAGQGGNPTIVGYSDVFNIGPDPACPVCLNPSLTVSSFPLTGIEGLCATQYLCSVGIINANQSVASSLPTAKLIRQDAAKILVTSLFTDAQIPGYNQNPLNVQLPTRGYVTPFEDLNNSSDANNYHQSAKVLIYLSYASDEKSVTPFRKSGVNFYPGGFIQRIDYLKLLCESYNLVLDAGAVTLPYTDITELNGRNIDYLKKALQLQIISNQSLFRPNDDITREEAFLMLKRLRAEHPELIPGKLALENGANYQFEQNVTYDNVSVMRSMASGNFAYSENGFAIPDIGFPLSFGFTYSSTITDWPDVYRKIEPLGVGWTHNFNSYILPTEKSETPENVLEGRALLLLANGDGTFHTFDNTNNASPIVKSIDTFNDIIVTQAGGVVSKYEVKRPDQVVFTYQKVNIDEKVFRLTQIRDRYNNQLTLTYKAATTASQSDLKVLLDKVTAPSGRYLTFQYNSTDKLTKVIFPGENVYDRELRFDYYLAWDAPQSERLQRYFSPKHAGNGIKSTRYIYGINQQGNAGSNQKAQKHIYMLKEVIRPKGNRIKVNYDRDNRVTQVEQGNENTTALVDKTLYDRTGCPAGIKCAKVTGTDGITYTQLVNDKEVIYEINSPTVTLRRPENDVNPSNPAWFSVNGLRHGYSYNAKGLMKTDTTYDKNGQVKHIQTWQYDDANNLWKYWEPNSNSTGSAFIEYNYSADKKYLLNVIQRVSSSTTLTQIFHQQTNGLLDYVIDPEGLRTNFSYNNYGNVNDVHFVPLDLHATATYDFSSRVKTSTNAKNQTSEVFYDKNDNVVKSISPTPLSYVTEYFFDDNDNVEQIKNARGKSTYLKYDKYDRDSTITFEGATQKYFYFDNESSADFGKMKEIRKPWANLSSGWNATRAFLYQYDAEGFLKSNAYIQNITYKRGSPSATNTPEENTMLSIQGGNNPAHLLSGFKYDDLVRLNEYTDYYLNTVKYSYDNNGNVTRITYPDNKFVDYFYDRGGRLSIVKWNSTVEVAKYFYTGSRLHYVQYGNGVRTTYSYDNAGRLAGFSTNKNSGTGAVIAAYTFEFDNVGNHLTENITEPYQQPTLPAETISYSYDDGNRILTMNNVTFTHDGDGNVKTKGSRSFTYDLEDNLTKIEENGVVIAQYEYDAFGNRRWAKRGSTETRYVLDLLGLADVLAETNTSNAIQNYYIHGMGLVARVKADGTLHYYHGDYRGSVVAMTNDSQAITHKYQYDDFGKLLNEIEADANPFKYVGLYGIMHEGPDLAYMRARYYDPETGRFNGADPIWSNNLYPYANNNGVMNVDPSGKINKKLLVTGGILLAGAAIGVVSILAAPAALGIYSGLALFGAINTGTVGFTSVIISMMPMDENEAKGAERAIGLASNIVIPSNQALAVPLSIIRPDKIEENFRIANTITNTVSLIEGRVALQKADNVINNVNNVYNNANSINDLVDIFNPNNLPQNSTSPANNLNVMNSTMRDYNRERSIDLNILTSQFKPTIIR